MEIDTLLSQLDDALTICREKDLSKTTRALEEIFESLLPHKGHLATSPLHATFPSSSH